MITRSNRPIQIHEKIKNVVPIFCEKCNDRRLPKWMKEMNMSLWLCETCKNYVDAENHIIRNIDE